MDDTDPGFIKAYPSIRLIALQMAFASLNDHDEPLCHVQAIAIAEEILAYLLLGTVPLHPPEDGTVMTAEEVMQWGDNLAKKYGTN